MEWSEVGWLEVRGQRSEAVSSRALSVPFVPVSDTSKTEIWLCPPLPILGKATLSVRCMFRVKKGSGVRVLENTVPHANPSMPRNTVLDGVPCHWVAAVHFDVPLLCDSRLVSL
jgi:hypothetical protein